MRRDLQRYCLTDTQAEWLVKDLTQSEVSAILASRPRSRDQDLLVWTEDWYAWKGLEEPDCQIFFNPRIEIQKPPPVPLVPNLDMELATPKKGPAVGPAVPTKPPPPQAPALSHLLKPSDPPARRRSFDEIDDLTRAPGSLPLSPEPLAKSEGIYNADSKPEFTVDIVDDKPGPVLNPTSEDIPGELLSEQSEITLAPDGDFLEQTEITRVAAPGSDLALAMPLGSAAESTTGKQRQFHRYAVQLPVVIQSPVGEFRTWTVDVSEGGARLRDPLPSEIAGYNQITFFLANAAPITILASLVEDSQAGRVHVQFMDGPGQALFIHWMREQNWVKAA